MRPSKVNEPRSQNKNVRELVAELKRHGVVFEGFRSKHPYYVDPATSAGREVPMSPSRRYWRVDDTKKWCDILGARASERLKNWAHLTRKSPKETPPRARDARIADTLPAVLALVPSLPLTYPEVRYAALRRLAEVCISRRDYVGLRKIHDALSRLENRCAVKGCPGRSLNAGMRLCAMHADDDAFTEVNVRFYMRLMSADAA